MASGSPNPSSLQQHPAVGNRDSANAPESNQSNTQSTPTGKRKSSTAAQDAPTNTPNANGAISSQDESGKKKRRKVNHACVYCRRSHMTCDLERPCARCVKRDIGHLCHDEPRDPPKKGKSEVSVPEHGASAEPEGLQNGATSAMNGHFGQMQDQGQRSGIEDFAAGTSAAVAGGGGPGPQHLAQTSNPISPTRLQRPVDAVNPTSHRASNVNGLDWAHAATNNGHTSNQFQDMHHLHPNYMFNTSEATNEYKLLNDFLSSSMLDDGGMYSSDDAQAFFNDPIFATTTVNPQLQQNTPGQRNTPQASSIQQPLQQPQPQRPQSQQLQQTPTSSGLAAPPPPKAGEEISRPSSVNQKTSESSRNKFYMTAADPAGHSSAEDRLHKLLKAKYDAGMLKPFNYVKGYARLNSYMARHFTRESQMRILKQLDRFRPKFREAMQSLTDMQLVLVEMWFERSLMEYDRVFASMAIPACCWRRTGEIFRGNREMAELIAVPWEKLRDGKLAIHEVMREDSLVSYWEKFGAIAFDGSQKAILTSCSLKKPKEGERAKDGGTEGVKEGEMTEVKCCFSFTIRRDTHNM